MGITFKLYAGLTQYLPHEARVGNAMPLPLPDGATVLQAMQPFNLPMKIVKLVLVNGVYIAPERWPTHALRDGDVLAIWPPVAGG
ncbi:MAG TPA: MoaD/ThiS family protein [Rubrivivax sp.]|nr:MoaD/ThiS family protein [Rubrivivax sp.]